ncbi:MULTISPECIES: hypothetical protein [unclassified Streptomyces]|nr:hypothetical protein [Streptomyces sp. SHP 1-2]
MSEILKLQNLSLSEPEGSEDQQVAEWSTVSSGCNNNHTRIEG